MRCETPNMRYEAVTLLAHIASPLRAPSVSIGARGRSSTAAPQDDPAPLLREEVSIV